MKRILIYIGLMLAISGCEEIYTPHLEKANNVVVVDARIVKGAAASNVIQLSQSIGFNEDIGKYPAVHGASVALVDNNDYEYDLPEISPGNFKVDFELRPERQYKLRINYNNDVFESTLESVPEIPQLDTIYGDVEEKVLDGGGTNSVNDFWKRDVMQFYVDINQTPEINNYRFTWRKVTQYMYIETFGGIVPEVPHYVWFSSWPSDIFNIASPPEYKAEESIKKHPVFYVALNEYVPVHQDFESFGSGYIFILYQYALSKSAVRFYKDLNSQLGSEGHIFDPLYVQARNNLKCVTNPEKTILGNFEITAVKERRYFVKYLSKNLGFVLKEIPYFYDIPSSGDIGGSPPDFWETETKTYP